MSDAKLNAEQREWLLSAIPEAAPEGSRQDPSPDDFLRQKITWDLFEKLFRSPIASYINRQMEPTGPYPRIPFQPGETVEESLNRFLAAKHAAYGQPVE
jgi:hypothetical protein